jgi:leader peptidase (prepilin peptidase)/N-methyltransferase
VLLPSTLLAFTAFALGAIIGSFLNVVIHRYPREESIVFPPSHCPNCNSVIKPYDNIPILSWLLLRARCRTCREPISARYPIVELANGLFWLAVYQRTGPTVSFLLVSTIVSMLLILIYVDLDHQFLPDVVDKPGIAVGLVIGALNLGAIHPELQLAVNLLDSIIGAVVGGGILLAIAYTYRLVRNVEGMGLGDVKMLAMLGAVVGWEALFPLLLIASVFGAVIGLIVAAGSTRGLQVPIPFGVFLGIAAFVVLFFGPTLSGWYLALLVR